MEQSSGGRNRVTPPRLRSSPVVTALARGLAILEAFGQDGRRELSLRDLSRRVSLSKSTTHRLVWRLIEMGYIKQNVETHRYYLQPRVLNIGYALLQGMDMNDLASPSLKELSLRCGETVNMAIRDGVELVYVERLKTQQIININLHVGSRLPLHNTSMGRALIAYQPQQWLREYISQLPPEAAEYARRGGRKLLGILEEARRKKYAINNEDLAKGLRSVATQIWNRNREVVAAVNIAVPSVRVSLKGLEEIYAPQLLETAREISATLGGTGGAIE